MKFNMRYFKRANGFFYYEFGRGKRRSLHTKDRREALHLYNILKREYFKRKISQLDGVKKITLYDFQKMFFSRHTDISEKTGDAYRLAFKLLANFVGWSTLLSRINENLINKFKAECLARRVKKVSVNTYLRHIRSFLNKAHAWGFVDAQVKIKMYRLPKRHPRLLDSQERDLILSYAEKHNYEIYRVILFALWTGARRAEIASLTWNKVEKDMCRIIGKGDKERTIPLLAGAKIAMGTPKDIGYVFQHWKDLSKYTKAFKKIARACGINDVHFHHLRHTAGTQMLKSGISIEIVQEMLGHENISTTQIYAKVIQSLLRKEMQKMHY